MEIFGSVIDSAIERIGSSSELNIRAFFYERGEVVVPSRLFQGEGTCNLFKIDDTQVGINALLKKGGIFTAHKHPDAIEIIHVNRGLILEVITGIQIKAGEEYKVEAGVLHQYEILEDCQVVMNFIFV